MNLLAEITSWPQAFAFTGAFFVLAFVVAVIITERWPWDRKD